MQYSILVYSSAVKLTFHEIFFCILVLLEIFPIKFVITLYLFTKLHCALKSEEPFPISFNPPYNYSCSLQKLPPCLTLLCPILIFRRCPIKFRLKILMSNHPGRSSVGHSLDLQEPHQNNEDRLFSDEDYGIIKGLINFIPIKSNFLSSLSWNRMGTFRVRFFYFHLSINWKRCG